MKLNWKRETVKLFCEADAFVSGPFAVHLAIDGKKVTLTHIQSGWRIADFESEAAAMHFAACLPPVDWNFSDSKTMPSDTRRVIGAAARKL
jgi:hypothetical protein